MNNFELKSTKFLLIIAGICTLFAVVVMHAYQYLPQEPTKYYSQENTVQKSSPETPENNIPEQDFINSSQEKNIELEQLEREREKAYLRRLEQEREIERNKNKEKIREQFNNEESYSQDDLIKKAERLKNKSNYSEAIKYYQEASNTANEKEKAFCYEQIATIHAIQKHYGTALSFAQKAYNTYPNTQREILLARLYYKTGNIDKATNRINNILKRDFEQDR